MSTTDTKLFRYCFSVLLSVMLVTMTSSCGFQLRGAVEVSSDVEPVYLQANSSFELAREVRRLIRANDIAITENTLSANSQIVLQGENKHSRVLSVDSDGRAREYLLIYDVDIVIRLKSGDKESFKEISERLSLNRTLLFNQDAVLAVSNESAILYDDMRRQAARLILMKLQASSTGTDSVETSSAQTGSAGKEE